MEPSIVGKTLAHFVGSLGPCALAKVILLTRDESDLIDDFLAYWGAIFDPENVVVVDNGSTSVEVLASYESHRAKGGTVIVDTRPFNAAVGFMTEHMKAIADSGTCEWIFPIETDEFIFFHPFLADVKHSSIKEIREAIHAHIREIPPEFGAINYGHFWGSCVDPADESYVRGTYARPALEMTRFYDQAWDKLIVRASAFQSMRQWCHHANCKPGYKLGKSIKLGLVHFHDAGKRRAVERAVPVVEGYGYVKVQHRTPMEQLQDAGRLRNLSLSCGHKLAYLDAHLRRLSTLRAFRRYLGRLPADAEEMLEISDHSDVLSKKKTIDGIVRALTRSSSCVRSETPSSSPSTWDDLLYHETRMDHTFIVNQVQSAIHQLHE